MFYDEMFFEKLREELPPVFTREFASEEMGYLYTAKSLSNADSLGTSPSVKLRIGKKVGYEREVFIRWLKGKIKYDSCTVKKEKHYVFYDQYNTIQNILTQC